METHTKNTGIQVSVYVLLEIWSSGLAMYYFSW